MFKKKKTKNKEQVVEEYVPFNTKFLNIFIVILITASFVLTLTQFVDDYNHRPARTEPTSGTQVFQNRYEYIPRGANGACPSLTAAYNETACLKLKNN
jgi:hypothetical protein